MLTSTSEYRSVLLVRGIKRVIKYSELHLCMQPELLVL